jgi:hypothetical protein
MTLRISLLMLMLACSSLTSGHAEELQAGVAVVDITPPIGMRMSGYFSERLSTGKHDPLQAKALVLIQGETKAAFVACDLIGIPAAYGRKARDLAAKQTGIPAEHIALHGTHSHTGVMYFGALRKYFHDQAVAKSGSDPYEKFDFPAHLIEGVAQAVELAAKAARPVKLLAGKGEETKLSFNRRFHMKDGTVRFNPGKNNPDIVRVAGPIDPDVGLLFFHDAQTEKPLVSLTSFAMHLDTVSGTEYSADYPFYLENKLRENFGPAFVSLFGTGTCGDINHVDVKNEKQLRGRPECERLGTSLGETVLASLDKLQPQKEPKLAVKRGIVEVPLQEYSDEQIKKAAANMAKIGSRELSFLEQVEASKITDLQVSYTAKTLPIEVQAIRLSSDVAIVTLPGEVFVELGLAIKQASPFETTLVIELCNDNPAYIPTKKAFAEGSYETVNSRVQSGGGEKMVELTIKLLKELK